MVLNCCANNFKAHKTRLECARLTRVSMKSEKKKNKMRHRQKISKYFRVTWSCVPEKQPVDPNWEISTQSQCLNIWVYIGENCVRWNVSRNFKLKFTCFAKTRSDDNRLDKDDFFDEIRKSKNGDNFSLKISFLFFFFQLFFLPLFDLM